MDVSSYTDIFLAESREHLENLNQLLLELEANPGNTSALDGLFRSAHTLKGMAATMEFNQITRLIHEMENVLSGWREQRLAIKTEVLDTLFQCLDSLAQMVSRVELGQGDEIAIEEVVARLAEVSSGRPLEAPVVREDRPALTTDEYDNSMISQARAQGYQVYLLEVEVDRGCLMKAVRAYMVFKSLEEVGDIIKSTPSAQELEEGNFDQRFELLLVTRATPETLAQQLAQISEVRLVRCELFAAAGEEGAAAANSSRPAEEAGEETAAVRAGVKMRQTVRVDIERLDNLMNLVGELVINKTRLEQIGATHNLVELNETVEQFSRISTDLQTVVMKVRMVPVEQVFNRFPRMVRDLSRELGKEVNFLIEGKETELDRTVIDEIGDPLVHLLRNAIDHGIELPQVRQQLGKSREGTVRLTARHEGNSVIIEVADDGAGISLEKVKARARHLGWLGREEDRIDESEILDFIFRPGFSTAEVVTDLSGRGVGLDAVRAKIESLNGTITVENQPGSGTCFRIRLPLTLAIIQALLVRVGDEIYAIPLSAVDETTIVYRENIRLVQSQEVVLLRGQVLPLLRLGELLKTSRPDPEKSRELFVVVVRRANRRVGLVVDSLIGQQEIVIKSLGKMMSGINGLAGATILGDGQVSLILDIGTLF